MGNSDKDFEKSNQCAFDAYCKVILRNEARDAYDQRKRKLKREQLFGEMSPEELNKLITTDRYFQFERDIVEDGLHFIVCDQGVYDALMTLPGAKKDRPSILLRRDERPRNRRRARHRTRQCPIPSLTCARNDAKDARTGK